MSGYWIIGLLLLVFLFLLYRFPREPERYDLLKLFLYLASGLLVFRIGELSLPLGILIAWLLYLRRRESKPNRMHKRIALGLACGLFAANSFLLPFLWTPVGSFQDTWDRNHILAKLQGVRAVNVFEEDSAIQAKLSGILDPDSSSGVESEIVRGMYWVCINKGIPVKDAESLWFSSEIREKYGLHPSWQRQKKGNWVQIQADSGEQYLLVFKNRSDGSSYLSYAIEHQTVGGNPLNPLFSFP
ncbi:hypothetical protein [Gorillibacterium timonense]|uniref:hypothetical protein n=1 Tax=Gorillibacterium timonense TaxID=1689269 RepID=UPI00071CFD86|nr:hypothetical protein [Gorillibacterium timonense]